MLHPPLVLNSKKVASTYPFLKAVCFTKKSLQEIIPLLGNVGNEKCLFFEVSLCFGRVKYVPGV